MNSWNLLWYYETQNEDFERLKKWNEISRKQLYNIEFPFSHAKQLVKLFVELWIAEYDSSIFIYRVDGWQKPILDGIRLWLLESLKEHHKNRWKVEQILNIAFVDDWISSTLEEDIDINDLKKKIAERISSVARDM